MADLTIVPAKVAAAQVFEQFTGPANVAILAGQVVGINTTTGFIELVNTDTGSPDRPAGVALSNGGPGKAVTVLKRGLVDLGAALDGLAFDAPVYASDVDGVMAGDAGVITIKIGRVHPNFGDVAGQRLLWVDIAL